jgi:DNA primase
MDSQIEEIKNKLNVLDIVGSYVKLTKTGINHRGLCPFHSEKGPSFFVSPGRQMWKCFGCGKGGDIFEFIKEIEGVEFGDALRILANKAGVELKHENVQSKSERKRLYEICELACAFFEKQLGNSAFGKEAKDYLLKRGISDESIKKWRLGYSPDTWQGLSDFLVGRGYIRDEIVKAGLAVPSEKGNNPYDRFRGRIIFPIFDSNSQVVGFGARIFKELDKGGGAKYINTPQTMLYDKSNVLYGLNFAKVSIRKKNQCVLTEGYTDTIMCHQAGFDNTVAVSGTALTPQHLNILKRHTDNLLLSFDMDVAGDTATKRGINLAESQGFNIKVISSYSEKDPADIILEDPKIWEKAVLNTRSIMDFYFDSAFTKHDKLTPLGKKEIGKIILPAIKRIQNKIEQSHWVQKLAEKLGVSETAVVDELKNVKIESQDINYSVAIKKNTILEVEEQGLPVGRKKLLEDKIVSLILKNPADLILIPETHYCYFSNNAKVLIEKMKFSANQHGNDINAILADLPKDEYGELLDVLALKAEVDWKDDGPDEVSLCLLALKDIELRNMLGCMSEAIKKEQDEQKRADLIKEFNNKAKELHQKV